MKKLIPLLLMLMLVACSTAKYDVEDTITQEQQIIESSKVELLISEVSQDQIAYVMINHTDQKYLYGEPYHLEVKIGKQYRILKMKENVAFKLPGYYLLPKESVKATIQPLDYYQSLPKGNYRLVKSIFDDKNQMKFIVGEFTLP